MKLKLYKVLTMVLDKNGGGFPTDTTNPDDQYLWMEDLKEAEKIFKAAFLSSPYDGGRPIKQIVSIQIDERTYKRCIRQDEGSESINYACDFDWKVIKEAVMNVQNPEASKVIEERYIFN